MNDTYTLTLAYQNQMDMDTIFKDETLFHVANGLIGKKGYFIEGYGIASKRTVVMNGFYNRYSYHYEENAKEFPQFGKTIMPLPEPFFIKIEALGSEVNLTDMEHIHTLREFHLDKGYTTRITQYKNQNGHRIQIKETQLSSLEVLGLVQVGLEITSLDSETSLNLTHHVEMPHVKASLERDPRVAYEKKHIEFVDANIIDQQVVYAFKTLSEEFHGQVTSSISQPFKYEKKESQVIGQFDTLLKKGETFSLTIQALYQTNHCVLNKKDHMLIPYDEALQKQESFIALMWEKQKLGLSNQAIDRTLKYHIYQLYVSGAVTEDLSIAAKGLSGEGYEGHYFWDTEMYMLPFFVMHHPDKAKNILKHRMKHLEKAYVEARKMGVEKGAKVPWRSIDGTELSPYFLAGSAQLHINSDIAYGFILYTETTGDKSLLKEGGFEFILELGLYIIHYGHMKEDGFHLPLVTGPDEYTPLVYDNYYTNQMAKFHLKYLYDNYPKYQHTLKEPLDEDTLNLILNASEHMVLLYNETYNIHLQDRDHFERKPLPSGILPNEGLPLMLKKHPHFIYRHQVLKQADSIASDVILNHYDTYFNSSFHHYLKITSHDSSLSKCMYGIGAYQIGLTTLGDSYFEDVLFLDIRDDKKHTKNGLHLANTGGAFLMVLKGLLGIHTLNGLSIKPSQSAHSHKVSYQFLYHNQRVSIELDPYFVQVTFENPTNVKIYDHQYENQLKIKVERI